MVVTGIEELPHRLEMLLGIRTTRDGGGDVVFAHQLRRLFEVARERELLTKLAS